MKELAEKLKTFYPIKYRKSTNDCILYKNGTIYYTDYTDIVHETAHWAVATPTQRTQINYGLGTEPRSYVETVRIMPLNKASLIEAEACMVTIAWETLWYGAADQTEIFWQDISRKSPKIDLTGDTDAVYCYGRRRVQSAVNKMQKLTGNQIEWILK